MTYTQNYLKEKEFQMEPVVGFEPTTDGLQNRCSTTELNWRRRALPRKGTAGR